MFGVNSRCQRSHQSSNPNQTVSAISASAFWKNDLPGDSKWPFHPLVGGHLTPSKGHLTIPKRSLWITRLEKCVYITCSDCSTRFRKTWIERNCICLWQAEVAPKFGCVTCVLRDRRFPSNLLTIQQVCPKILASTTTVPYGALKNRSQYWWWRPEIR